MTLPRSPIWNCSIALCGGEGHSYSCYTLYDITDTVPAISIYHSLSESLTSVSFLPFAVVFFFFLGAAF